MKLVTLLAAVIVTVSASPVRAQGQRYDPCNFDQQRAISMRWAATARHITPAEARRSNLPTWEQQQAQTARMNARILRDFRTQTYQPEVRSWQANYIHNNRVIECRRYYIHSPGPRR